jgi:uncharacterized protein YjdB
MILTDTQKVSCTIAPLNAKGNPAPVDGVPEWSSSNPSVATVTPAADGLSAVVTAVGIGVAQISVVADADMDAGETRELTGTLDIDVRASEAVTLSITAGAPEEQ